MRRLLQLATVLGFAFACGACEKEARNMYEQPRYNTMAQSPFWPDGRSARPLESGVVVHSAGILDASSSGRAAHVSREPPSADAGMDFVLRGRDRYDIYCAPCHSVTGDGDGMVVRRGFPRPGSFHTDAARAWKDARIYDAITSGYGMMVRFDDRLAPDDRKAIVAYIRALQLSRHAPVAALDAADRSALDRTPGVPQ